jgi:hypothetical protein
VLHNFPLFPISSQLFFVATGTKRKDSMSVSSQSAFIISKYVTDGYICRPGDGFDFESFPWYSVSYLLEYL